MQSSCIDHVYVFILVIIQDTNCLARYKSTELYTNIIYCCLALDQRITNSPFPSPHPPTHPPTHPHTIRIRNNTYNTEACVAVDSLAPGKLCVSRRYRYMYLCHIVPSRQESYCIAQLHVSNFFLNRPDL